MLSVMELIMLCGVDKYTINHKYYVRTNREGCLQKLLKLSPKVFAWGIQPNLQYLLKRNPVKQKLMTTFRE